jgi:hypothetical protein
MNPDLITEHVLSVLLGDTSRANVNDGETTFLDSLLIQFSLLKDVVNNHPNITIQSRAFDSIMKLRQVDK